MASGGAPKQVCRFFESPGGCWYGEKCRFLHEKSPSKEHRPACKFYRGPGTCRHGDDCYFLHADGDFPLLSPLPDQYLSALGLLHVKTSTPNDDNHKIRRPEVVSPSEVLSFDLLGSDGEKAGGEYSSDFSSSSNSEGGALFCSPPPKSVDSKYVTCGECGAKFSIGDSLNNVTKDSSDSDDDGEDEEQGKVDPLEKHYMDKLLALDQDHIKFLRTDYRFKQETSCGVCGKVFSRAQSLLSHIVGKVRSQKNDWKAHKTFLETIIIGFLNRDYGIEDEDKCDEWLLMHFVDSYEGDGSSNDMFDSQHSDVGGLAGLLGLMALGKHLHRPSSSVTFFSSSCDMFGFDDDDIFDLACQGIKPWDPEARAALAVLNGDYM